LFSDERVERDLLCLVQEFTKHGNTNIHLRSLSIRAGGYRILWSWHRYFIWGGQALFGFPKASPEVNRTMGMWGFWMPGFMQFITGAYLLIGLT
jgi:hypothetical protein